MSFLCIANSTFKTWWILKDLKNSFLSLDQIEKEVHVNSKFFF